MKKRFLYLSCFLLLKSAFGQSKAPQTSIDNAPVLDEVIYQQGKDSLIIQRIEQPEFLGGGKQAEPSAPSPDELKAVIPTQTFIISATKYKNQKTHFKIWPPSLGEQAALSGWSNIDWSVLSSLLAVEDETKRYQFMLFHSPAPSSKTRGKDATTAPAELPDFRDTGARYLISSGEESERDSILDFLESIHALYDNKRDELHQNHALVIANHEKRKRQIKREAKKPKTRVLKIWRHTRSESE